jgi:hypothetical protein
MEASRVLPFRAADLADKGEPQGKAPMKTTTIFMLVAGVAALGACNKSPTEQAAQNVESNYGNVAENVEATTSNAAESIECNAENASSEVKAAGENQAEAIKNQGEQKANEIRNQGNGQ